MGCKRIIEEKIEPGHLEFETGKGTSVNELISTVKKVTGKNIDIVKKDYVLKEARRPVAEKPFIKDPMSLDKGIKEVADFIMNDRKPVSNSLRYCHPSLSSVTKARNSPEKQGRRYTV